MANGHYLVLARKWRPNTFEDVVGQEHITRTLQNAIRSGRIPHAFLFIGSRGIGKTTSARIVAKALNCTSTDAPTPEPCGTCDNCVSIASGTNLDVIEIDGASNNGVDDIRQIRENIRMVPSASRYKIYVIDEVHQLSQGAFNALLKTLEEPPAHAIFILATTEAHKIPATIISRCQRYDFRRVGLAQLTELLRRILDAEKISCSDDALHAIARAADGGVRDAESILDQLMSYCGDEIAFKDVFDVLGLVDWQLLHDVCEAIQTKDVNRLMTIVDDVVVAGKDLGQFVQEVLRYFRNLLLCRSGAPDALLALPDEEVALMKRAAEGFTLMELIRLVEQFAELTRTFDSQLAQRTALEAALIRISTRAVDVSLDTVLEKIALLNDVGVTPTRTGTKTAAAKKSESKKKEPTEPAELNATPSAQRKCLQFDDSSLAGDWTELLENLRHEKMNLATWLSHGHPTQRDGDILVLRFDAGQEQSRAIVERAENRDVVVALLREHSDTVQDIRCEIARAELASESAEASLPVREGIDREAAKRALENPLIHSVVETFRGQIVDIQSARDEQLS